jgi:uncharacterized DUF497 family protein
VRLDELIWDDWNDDHVRRHGVEPSEIEEAVVDRRAMVLRTRGREERRYIVLGKSEAGRRLFVVLEPLGANRGYVITARDMSESERRRYEKRRRP